MLNEEDEKVWCWRSS